MPKFNEKPVEEKPVEKPVLSLSAKKLEADLAWMQKVQCHKDTASTDLASVKYHTDRVRVIYSLYELSEKDCR